MTAEFQVIAIRSLSSPTLPAQGSIAYVTVVRFELVGTGTAFHREQRIGNWELRWEIRSSGEIRLQQWRGLRVERGRGSTPTFRALFSHAVSFKRFSCSPPDPRTNPPRTAR